LEEVVALSLTALATFGAVSLGMVLTPGPNMAYLVSRSIRLGRVAGLVSPGGVASGFVTYMLLAAGSVAAFLAGRPFWMAAQRWLMATVLAALAVRMAFDTGRR
jgi:threonine/homoserine/homoserine lactone efflux protein